MKLPWQKCLWIFKENEDQDVGGISNGHKDRWPAIRSTVVSDPQPHWCHILQMTCRRGAVVSKILQRKQRYMKLLFLGDLGPSHGSDTLADGHKPCVLYYKNNVPIPNLNPTPGWQEYFNTLHGVWIWALWQMSQHNWRALGVHKLWPSIPAKYLHPCVHHHHVMAT
jgi:hypothetical protein